MLRGFKEKAEALVKTLSPEQHAKDIKIKNPAAVKKLARDGWNILVEVKNHKLLQGNSAFEDAYKIMQYGKDMIILPSKAKGPKAQR